MTKHQRELFDVTDAEWKLARDRVREAMVGGRMVYMARNDKQGRNGQHGTIRKVILSTREIEVVFDNGQPFRAFAHNVSLG